MPAAAAAAKLRAGHGMINVAALHVLTTVTSRGRDAWVGALRSSCFVTIDRGKEQDLKSQCNTTTQRAPKTGTNNQVLLLYFTFSVVTQKSIVTLTVLDIYLRSTEVEFHLLYRDLALIWAKISCTKHSHTIWPDLSESSLSRHW